MVETNVESDSQDEQEPKQHSNKTVGLILGSIGLLVLGAWGTAAIVTSNDSGNSSSSSASSSTEVTAKASDCPVISGQSWPLNYDPSRNGDVVEGGVHSPEDIKNAAKVDPKVLVGYGQQFLPATFPAGTDYHKFVDQSGKCLNLDGVVAFKQLEAYENQSSVVKGQADSSWVNTGMGAGGIVSNATPGITGNMNAWIYTTPDNRKVVILERCGNPAEQVPSYPKAPPTGTAVPPPPVTTVPPPPPTTGTPPPPPTTETPPPPTTTTPPPPPPTLVPKDPSVDPYPRGNAPQGGGPNDQPGPGPSNIPTQPPATPRTNPPRPVATSVPGTPAPTRVSTPVTAPPPEPGVNGNGTGTTTIPHTDPTGGVTTSVVITTAVPKPQ